MKNTFTCLFSMLLICSGIYGCAKNEQQQPVAAVQVQSSTTHGSFNQNPGALHNKVVWTYMNNNPQEQIAFTKTDVLQMTRDVLGIMADEGYYEGHLDDIGTLATEMLAGMEEMGYFTISGQLKSTQELKDLPLYSSTDNLLQKVINKINLNQSSTAAEFIAAAHDEMNSLTSTAYETQAVAFNSIIDSSSALVPRFMNFALPAILLPSGSNLRIAYADAKGYLEGTKAARDLGKNTLQQDIWGMTYSTTRSAQQFKREIGF